MFKLKTITSVLLILSIVGCGDNHEKLTVSGSSTVAPLIVEIAKQFEANHENVRIDVQTGGSSRGINDTRKGLADIGMVSRELNSSEQNLSANVIAWDGITIILHSENPIDQLSREQVIAIYRGDINNWQQLGGPNKAIVVVNKAQGRSTLELFSSHFQLNHREIKADVIVGDNQQGLKTVAGNVMAIGYVSIGSATYEAEHGSPIKLLAVDGIAATLTNVEQGLFPISRPLNLVTQEQTSALAQEFIRFARSATVSDTVLQHYFIPPETVILMLTFNHTVNT